VGQWQDWFSDFDESVDLTELLGVHVPLVLESDAHHRQLRYIARYAMAIGAKSIAIEPFYIDRDFIEDYSVFYAKCLTALPNHCRRLHFFSRSAIEMTDSISRCHVATEARMISETASDLSDLYLGFSVIKPLPASPVGRTVLANYPAQCELTSEGHAMARHFNANCTYGVHFLGLNWTVSGLAFQQQDTSVSACATTAIWTSLHRAGRLESIRPVTPVSITQLATEFSIPGGRPMPGGELDVGQMCQAVRGCGFSPMLFQLRGMVSLARFLIRSALQSGHAPILMCRNSDDEGHAVTVVGQKLLEYDDKRPLTSDARLRAIYIHDDRIGPNVLCELDSEAEPSSNSTDDSSTPKRSLTLKISIDEKTGNIHENWTLTHLLIPMHPKIRMSFSDLRTLSKRIQDIGDALPKTLPEEMGDLKISIQTDSKIVKANDLIKELLVGTNDSSPLTESQRNRFLSEIRCSRYVGVVTVRSPGLTNFVCLFDTTNPLRHLSSLVVVALGPCDNATEILVRFVSKQLGCLCIH
jgi:hypothetical protein